MANYTYYINFDQDILQSTRSLYDFWFKSYGLDLDLRPIFYLLSHKVCMKYWNLLAKFHETPSSINGWYGRGHTHTNTQGKNNTLENPFGARLINHNFETRVVWCNPRVNYRTLSVLNINKWYTYYVFNKSFADDTTLYSSNSDIKHLLSYSNRHVNDWLKWLCENKLSLNASRSKYIIKHQQISQIYLRD